MYHQIRKKKLGRTTEHRKALWYNLFRSLVLYGKIETTHAKALSLLPIAEKYITESKEYSLATYRKILSFLRNDTITANKLFKIGEIFKDVPGGYLKIVKLGARKGDGAAVSCVMFSKEVSL